MCEGRGRNTLVLMAQAVPAAEHVPCITALPSGWVVQAVEVKDRQARVVLGVDPTTGHPAVTMRFTSSCETGDAVEVPSDEQDARRFEDVEEVTNGYRGTSYTVFDGGCVGLTFDIAGEGWSAAVNDASAAFSLASRGDLVAYMREYSNGVIEDF